MAWRTLLIQNPARLSLWNNQLALDNDDGRFTFPAEDLTVVILDTPQIQLSSALLSYLQERGVAVLTCDKKHMPNGLLTPFQPHSRQSEVAYLQLSWTAALKKRLWQRIVRTKIENQAACLKRHDGKGEKRLLSLAASVKSGDPDNIEAQAARYYFPCLFDKTFKRREDNIANAALNYAYAVLRACVARSLVSYGLIPAFGLHHNNNLNAFNLADDVLEVFRPFADDLVMRTISLEAEETLSVQDRQVLAGISTASCDMEGEHLTMTTACDRISVSLIQAIKEKNPKHLVMPSFIKEAER